MEILKPFLFESTYFEAWSIVVDSKLIFMFRMLYGGGNKFVKFH
jgi:hypothetical protein